jgi:hypothetical protein
MKKEYRDLDKLRSSRSKAIKGKRAKYGKPLRKDGMTSVMIDHYQTQDREAAQRFAMEQELAKISMRMFGDSSKFEDLSPEEIQKVVDELGGTEYNTEI